MRKPIFIRHKSFNIFMGYSDPDKCAAANEEAAKETDKDEAKPARKSSRKAEREDK